MEQTYPIKLVISADGRGFSVVENGVSRTVNQVERLGTETTKSARKGADSLNVMADSAKVLGGILAAVSVAQIAQGIESVIRANAEINLLNQSLGVSRDALQSWQLVGQRAGIDIANTFKDVNEKIAEFATTGGGEAVDLFKRLKLDVNELIALSPDQQLLKIADAMGKVKDMSSGEKTFLLESLADDSSKLLPYLDNAAEKLREIDRIARDSGAIITQEQNEVLSEAGDNLAKIELAMKGAGNAAAVAGSELLNAVAGEVLDAALSLDDLINTISNDVKMMADAWDYAFSQSEAEATDYGSFLNDLMGTLFESLRMGWTYFPVWGQAAYEAAGEYGASWVYRAEAGFAAFKAAGQQAWAVLVDAAGAGFAVIADGAGQLVAYVIGRFADMADGVSSALGMLDSIPGLENAGAGVSAMAENLRSLEQSAASAGDQVAGQFDAMADGIRASATESEHAAKLATAQAQASLVNAEYALVGAQAYQDNAESQRVLNLEMAQAEQQFAALGSGIDEASKSNKALHVNQEAVNKALADNSDSTKKAAEASKAHGSALKSAVESLTKQRIELEHGKLAAQYYADRLKGLTDAEARAAAGASQYNSYLEERKKLQKDAAALSGDVTAAYLAELDDKGLSATALQFNRIKGVTDQAVESARQYQQAIEAVGKSATSTGSSVAASVNASVGAIGKAAAGAGEVVAKLQALGWSRNQAIGIAANLQRESRFNPSAVGDSGKAYGIAQWHPDRQANFAQAMGKNIRGSSLDDQLAFLTYEMTRGTEKGAGNKLRGADSAAQAAAMVSKYYERPLAQVKEMEHRAGIANGIAKSIGDAVPSFLAVADTSSAIAKTSAAAADQVVEYGGAIDAARVTAGDLTGLLNDKLDITMKGLVKSATEQAQQAQLTGEQYRLQQVQAMNIGEWREKQVMQEEQLANYAVERASIEQDAYSALHGMAANYTKELEKQNLSQTQIADLVGRKLAAETEKLVHNAEQQTQQLALSADEWRRIELAQDGYTDAQIDSIVQAEKLLETTRQIREAADRVGDGLLDGLMKAATGSTGVVESLKSTVENAFADLVLKPTIQPITKGVSDGITGMMTGQANPWAGLQQAYSQTMTSMQAGGWQGAATAAGVASTVSALFGGSQAETTGAAIGGAIGNAIGGPVVGAIGSVLGHLAGGLFEDDDSARAKFVNNGDPQDGWAFTDRNKHLYASSTFGQFGFAADGTHDLGEQGEAQLETLVQRMAQIDNAIAKFMPAAEVDRVRQTLADFQHTGVDFDVLLKERLQVITTGLSSTMQGLIDYSGDADSIIARIDELLTVQQQAIPALRDMGLQIGNTADAALAAAVGLSDAAGGLQNLTNVASAYYDIAYSEEERQQRAVSNAQAAVDAFNALYGVQVNSVQALRQYVESLDMTVSSNHAAGLAAMGLADDLQLLAGAAGNVSSAAAAADAASQALLDSANAKLAQQQTVADLFSQQLSAITSGLDDQLRSLESSYRDQIQAYEQAQDAASGLRDALRNLKTGDLTTLVPVKQLEAARAEFERLKRAAAGGDVDAAKKLESAGEALLRLSREYNASSTDYSKDFAMVEQGWSSVANLLEDQQDPQQDMLAAQRRLVDQAAAQAAQMAAVYGGIIGGNNLLDLLGDNINSLPPEIATALKDVLDGLTPSNPPTVELTKAEYQAKAMAEASKTADPSAQIATAFQVLLGRPVEAGGLAYWLSEMNNGMPLSEVIKNIIASTEFAQKHPNSHATGLYAVPYDNYIANLHAGEAVVDAASMAAMRKYGIPLRSQASGNNNIVVTVDHKELLQKVDTLTAEVKQLRAERNADAQHASGQRERHIGQSAMASRDTVRVMKMRYRK